MPDQPSPHACMANAENWCEACHVFANDGLCWQPNPYLRQAGDGIPPGWTEVPNEAMARVISDVDGALRKNAEWWKKTNKHEEWD